MEEHVVLSLEKYDEMKARIRIQSARIAQLEEANERFGTENVGLMEENVFLENAAIGLAEPKLSGMWRTHCTKQELIDENLPYYTPHESYNIRFCDHMTEEEFKELVGRVWERERKGVK